MNPLTLEKTEDLLLQLLGVQSWCFYSVNCRSIKFSYTVDLTLFEAQRSKLTKSAHVKRLLSEFHFSLSCLECHRILTHMQEHFFFSLGCLHNSPAVKQVTNISQTVILLLSDSLAACLQGSSLALSWLPVWEGVSKHSHSAFAHINAHSSCTQLNLPF